MKNKYLFYFLLISLLIFGVFSFIISSDPYNFNYKNYNKIFTEFKKKLNIKNLKNLENSNSNTLNLELENNLKSLNLEKKIKAESFLIYDISRSKVILGYNENTKRPLASVTKLMTAYIATLECKDNLKDKLDSLLIASDNSSADNIAENCPNYDDFVKKMNSLAVKNNLNLSFANPSGLDINDEKEASNFGDAISVAKLMNMLYIVNPKMLEHTTKDNFNLIKNTNEYAEKLSFLLGSKTGYTDIAGGNLVTMYEITPGYKIAIVILGSTKQDRFTDTFLLLKSYLNNIK